MSTHPRYAAESYRDYTSSDTDAQYKSYRAESEIGPRHTAPFHTAESSDGSGRARDSRQQEKHHPRQKATLPSSPAEGPHNHAQPHSSGDTREHRHDQGRSQRVRGAPVSLLGELQNSLRRSFPV
jgi:ABC-type nickel/cobalt efflux system permease component RcnA